MRWDGGMEDDGGAMPPKNEAQAPICESEREEKVICLHFRCSNGWRIRRRTHIWRSPHMKPNPKFKSSDEIKAI